MIGAFAYSGLTGKSSFIYRFHSYMKLTLGFAALVSTVFGNTLSDGFKELQIVGDFQGLRAWDLNNPDSTTNSPSAMLVRHLADGSAESLIDSTNGKIKAMCMTKDRKLYIGGDFTSKY